MIRWKEVINYMALLLFYLALALHKFFKDITDTFELLSPENQLQASVHPSFHHIQPSCLQRNLSVRGCHLFGGLKSQWICITVLNFCFANFSADCVFCVFFFCCDFVNVCSALTAKRNVVLLLVPGVCCGFWDRLSKPLGVLEVFWDS